MSIWFTSPTIEDANRRMQPVLGGHLGIRFTEFGDDYLRGDMPVEARTHQPMGILHGGASVVLARSEERRVGKSVELGGRGGLRRKLLTDTCTGRCHGR